jgi:hypothetical protein
MLAWRRCVMGVRCCLLLTVLAGCETFQGSPARLYTVAQEAADTRDVVLPQIQAGYYGASSDAERILFRNEYVARRMYIIDVEFTEFENGLTRERQEFGLASAVTAQALSTAGAVFTPASTVRVLSALASGVQASRGFYDSELLVNKTIQIVESQMESKRDDVAARILSRVKEGPTTYPLSAALHDLEDYYRAGTLTAGLIKAVGDAAAAAQASADEKVAVIRAQAINGVITDVRKPMAVMAPTILNPNGLTDIEKTAITPAVVIKIQTALCVETPSSDFGDPGTPARKALSDFFNAYGLGNKAHPEMDQMIDSPRKLGALQRATGFISSKGGHCAAGQTAKDVALAVKKP